MCHPSPSKSHKALMWESGMTSLPFRFTSNAPCQSTFFTGSCFTLSSRGGFGLAGVGDGLLHEEVPKATYPFGLLSGLVFLPGTAVHCCSSWASFSLSCQPCRTSLYVALGAIAFSVAAFLPFPVSLEAVFALLFKVTSFAKVALLSFPASFSEAVSALVVKVTSFAEAALLSFSTSFAEAPLLSFSASFAEAALLSFSAYFAEAAWLSFSASFAEAAWLSFFASFAEAAWLSFSASFAEAAWQSFSASFAEAAWLSFSASFAEAALLSFFCFFCRSCLAVLFCLFCRGCLAVFFCFFCRGCLAVFFCFFCRCCLAVFFCFFCRGCLFFFFLLPEGLIPLGLSGLPLFQAFPRPFSPAWPWLFCPVFKLLDLL